MVALDNPLKGWRVDRAEMRTIGRDLQRPECILAECDGTLWAADTRGGVMRIAPDGEQQLVTPYRERQDADAVSFEDRYVQAQGSLPNGLAFAENGDFIIANWGTGAVEVMTRDGRTRTLYTEIDGQPLGMVNFVLRDAKNRLWLTVTTRQHPWTNVVVNKRTDGYIALIDEKGIRIVAEGFCGTNEVRLDPREEWLYVVETVAWRISRLRVQPDGSLTDREVYGPSQLDGFPDGCAFDASGNLWVTLIHTDQLVAITPDGEVLTLLDDSNLETKKLLFEHFKAGTLTPEIMRKVQGTIAPWMASVTFGGPDLRTVYLGSLLGTTIPYFRSPVAGQPMIHWR
jgi:gluconolactonase